MKIQRKKKETKKNKQSLIVVRWGSGGGVTMVVACWRAEMMVDCQGGGKSGDCPEVFASERAWGSRVSKLFNSI
jgi:hypothetical protein